MRVFLYQFFYYRYYSRHHPGEGLWPEIDNFEQKVVDGSDDVNRLEVCEKTRSLAGLTTASISLRQQRG